MKNFQVAKCQSCGSSIVELQGQHLAKCSHCGSVKRVEIVGGVYNEHDFQVNFVKIIAIAKNSQGISVGIAYTYAPLTNMPAKTESGFKVKAGTFIVQEPSSWMLWAIGRKQRN